MKQFYSIPKMNEKDIVNAALLIRPIVNTSVGASFLRQLSEKEILDSTYLFIDYDEKVDFSTLQALADVKMLHTLSDYGFFKPTVGEVIRQIPKDLLEKTVAFQMMYGPADPGYANLFGSEFDEGFHVSIMRLYGPNGSTKLGSQDTFPAECPIGMTNDDLKYLRKKIAV